MSVSVLMASALTRPQIWLAVLGTLLVGATLALWAYYGTAVFFEMVRAGWAACF
jgi:hypothetical protein